MENNKFELNQEWSCKQNWVMDDGTIAYTKNKTYIIDKIYKNSFNLPSNECKKHKMYLDDDFLNYFELVNKTYGYINPSHYNNDKGSLYQFCEDKQLNSYEFDIIKRVIRCRKKGNFKEDLEKTKFLIDLYLKEFKQ
jgi:hypothetical protein